MYVAACNRRDEVRKLPLLWLRAMGSPPALLMDNGVSACGPVTGQRSSSFALTSASGWRMSVRKHWDELGAEASVPRRVPAEGHVLRLRGHTFV